MNGDALGSPLGPQTGEAVSTFATGFTDAARCSILVPAGFLLLGIVGAMRLLGLLQKASRQLGHS